MKEGFRECLRIVREFDQWPTSMVVWDGDMPGGECPSCIPPVSERLHVDVSPADYGVSDSGGGASDIDSIFKQLELVGLGVTRMRCGMMDTRDIEDLEPYLMIGIPGLVLFDIVMQSVDMKRGLDEIVCPQEPFFLDYGSSDRHDEKETDTFTTITEPNNGIIFIFWPKIISTKRTVEDVKKLTKQEIQWIRL